MPVNPDIAVEKPTQNATELAVKGMTCPNCARHVAEALQKCPGVAGALVSLEEGRAQVRWQPGAQPRPRALEQAVKAAGFQADALAAAAPPPKPSWRAGWGFNVALGAICTLPLALGEWVFGLAGKAWFGWAGLILALPVQFLCGARFYRGAWNQLKAGSSGMDTLVSLGSTAAFGYSLWALLAGAGGHLYFMEAAAIITLISLGHWLESRMARRAESSLRALLNLAPQTARRRNPDGSESQIAVAQLRVNDVVVLRPGDRVPTDGEALEGQSTVDESMLTGESAPAEKQRADKLYAGTVNASGQLIMRVTATGEATALAHIISAVQRAQNSRAQIQRLADRVSNIFVPIVVLIALASALGWGLFPAQAHALHRALAPFLWPSHVPESAAAGAVIIAAAVLIVACPCAMGLATPIALMAATNAAARRGILVRDGVALERAGKITAVLFDKTGTLTSGKPSVVDSQFFSDGSDLQLKLAAALARRSNHPLSRALAKLSNEEFSLGNWQEMPGAGLQAEFKGQTLRLGSLGWLKNSGVGTQAGAAFVEKWMEQGGTVLGLAAGPKLVGVFALQDSLKPGAEKVVRQLAKKRLKAFLVSGDNQLTALAIAHLAGIPPERVFAEVRPEGKSQLVKDLQAKGERIAFVGDGINDAPALEQADLGIAVSQASDVAGEAADLILLRSDIEAIPEAIALAQASLRIIKQNLFWAFFYNAAAVPLAALGFLSPVMCAATMGISDLVVIGNALRLRSRR